MRLRHDLHRLLRRLWPGGTVRARLALLYGALFLASGAVLLAVTTALWGNATGGPISVALGQKKRILAIGRPPKGSPRRFTPVGGHGGSRLLPGQHFGGPSARPPKGFLVALHQLGHQLRFVELSEHASDLRHLLLFAGVTLGGMALVSVFLGWLVGGRIVRPLRTITATTREISASNLHERLDLAGPGDEMKELGDTIDQLLSRLEASFETQRQFVANASHELRTPLATMRASIDVALGKPGPLPPALVALTDRLTAELDHMNGLLESLFALARAEHAAGEEPTSHPLDELARSSLTAQGTAIREAGLDVDVACDPRAVVTGNGVLLARMVDNLVENAVRHNSAGGFVRISSEVDGEIARLTIENSGEALGEETVASLTSPFRRGVSDRTGSDGGLGLGLSIVSAVVQSHGGRLVLTGRTGGGLRVEVDLPLERVLDAVLTP